MDKATIGTRIRYERQRLGLTLEELGNVLSISKQCLSGWEHGRNMPDIIVLAKMANIFGIDLKDFLNTNFENTNRTTRSLDSFSLTDKELTLISKFRSLSADQRKAIEILFGIK